jgi:TetR/AcrR family transcriptional regulator, transcriptional repressor for nem operon
VPRGRPRQFDPDEAVADAMEVFWERGYGATSIDDLTAGTGLTRGSIYKAFDSKKALFLQALDRYTAEGLERRAALLARDGAVREAIRAMLAHDVRRSSSKGCMLLAAATEMLPHDADVAERVDSMFRRMRALLADAIRRGQAAGEIAPERDAEAIALSLLCTIEGMRAVGKTAPPQAELERVVDLVMEAL